MSPTRREVTAAQTRDSLVQSATECICTDGFESVSLADLTDRAGVSKGAFYKHFPDKTAVFTEVFVGRLEVAEALITGACEELEGRPRGAGVHVASMAAAKFAMLSLSDPVHREVMRQAPEVLGSDQVAAIDDQYLLDPLLTLLMIMEQRDELVSGLPLSTAAALLIRVLCAGNTMVSAAEDMNSALVDEIAAVGAMFQGLVAVDLRSSVPEITT
ncbi:TetR/AcrR family transcriptional regulator [Gordonia sp. HY002]|uniref:TetR/AcrR family transcriptional regulator n=1 Tax=Gordonia zhenghanii TaxID=2911516 RepID=UPI001EF0348E|nr:TetR/AcrR family transcriptional regulator [Gordonia zhenghanii]MCF8572245.1 TetR/AcrR family transcriptional regulator [Gordonia zhenghanii]MCF8605077.1 TetR/AcrR family transcriptional regulator [Gordonia zhenghanii]